MKINKNKTLSAAIALLFAMSVFLVAAPSVNAVTYSSMSYIVAFPDPVGVGQPMTVAMWLSEYPQRLMIGGASTIGGDTWIGFRVTVTKPDGTTEILGPYDSDTMGAKYVIYTPTAVGTYKFQMSYPGQTYSAAQGGNTYKASQSAVDTVTVQQAPIASLSDGQIPTGYWQRPINDENRAWANIAGNWLLPGMTYYSRSFDGGSAFNPYTQAPNTAHIVWMKPIATGGLVGSPYGSDPYYTGSSYELKFQPPVVMNGVVYYNIFRSGSYPTGFTAVDIRTGKTLYTADIDAIPTDNAPTIGPIYGQSYGGINLGQIYNFVSVNQYGAFSYLWSISGSYMDMYDAFTGQHWLRIANVTSGTYQLSPTNPGSSGGDLLSYVYNPTRGWLALWNSTRCILRSTPTNLGTLGRVPNVDLLTVGAWYWRPPFNATIDWNYGIEWNTTIPTKLTSASFLGGQPHGGVFVASRTIAPADDSTTGWPTFEHTGYNATTGAYMWSVNHTDFGMQSRGTHITPSDRGVYAMYNCEDLTWQGFSTQTGAKLWGPTAPIPSAWAFYNCADNAGYGMLFGCGIDGIVNCYDITTGTLKWTWNTGSSGFETPYSNYPIYAGTVIADGKIYVNQGTHGNGAGYWKGNTMSCIDVNTGQLVWRVAGWFDGSTLVISDGYLVAHNYYDNQIYCFGKGLTATSVQAPLTATQSGDEITIMGTVTDQSPGQTCLGIPAAGTPAIADSSMRSWSEYLWMQKDKPMDATGVPVSLVAISKSSEVIDIGQVTSDALGMYATSWKVPATPGVYTIYANYGGSQSYFSSEAETAITVVAAAASTAAPLSASDVASAVVGQLPAAATPVPTAPSANDVANQVVSQLPTTDNTLLIAIVAVVVIALLIGVVNLVLMLKKKQA